MNLKHPKFDNEKTCKWCMCTFLPDENSSDDYCSDCTRLGYKLPEDGKKPPEEKEYFVKDGKPITNTTKFCRKCGKEFIAKHPATKYCDACRGKK